MYKRRVPFAQNKTLIVFVFIAVWVGLGFDHWAGSKIDNWLHDSALVYQHRQQWLYSAIVVLDDAVPIRVSRKQALPLFAKAAERSITAGAKGVFFDARVAKELEGRMPYAVCIKENGEVLWSTPKCTSNKEQQCQLTNSSAGNAPLLMSQETIAKFRIAPYLGLGQSDLPDFLLYGFDAAMAIPEQGIVVSDRLVSNHDQIARWFDLSSDHAVIWLAKQISPAMALAAFQNNSHDERCDEARLCRRIRLSEPEVTVRENGGKLVLPVSKLASCNPEIARQAASLLQDKVVIIQTTTPTEATDILVTPMTTAVVGPQVLTPGAQYLIDAVETFLNQDHPRKPDLSMRVMLFFLVALVSVFVGAFLKQSLLWLLAILIGSVIVALCWFNTTVQLWPFAATMLVFITAAGQTTGAHLLLGFKEGNLIGQYMPSQIHNLLLSLNKQERFQNRRCFAIVLMSDLAGYTTMTGLLQEPSLVLKLMNDYLGETSIVLQDKYNGWLESYVGDMVCYYWPYQATEKDTAYQHALRGALELALLQKQFFATVYKRYQHSVDSDVLGKISSIIDAGIGLTAGSVVMGDLGPLNGVRKFGIIGDPLNLAARLESLTRFFNTEIIISGNFVESAEAMGFAIRRLGKIKVKGRNEPEVLYALGYADDLRFQKDLIQAWEAWLLMVETEHDINTDCPDVYQLDKATIISWLDNQFLDDQLIWNLTLK